MVRVGQLGVWAAYRQIGKENAEAAAALVEELGLASFWLGGSPRLEEARPLLEATEKLAVGTSIVNIWDYEPADLAAEWNELEREFPGRLTVGLGVGHSEAVADYSRPLSAMREFLDALDAASPALPATRRAIAALGPKMLDLARERSRGSLPFMTTAEHTAEARSRLGTEALLIPGLSCVLDTDLTSARARARKHAAVYLGLENYAANFLRGGFEPKDLEDGGSDRLLDATVPTGSAEVILAATARHLEAGADHVALQAIGQGLPADEWRALAAAAQGST